MGTLQKKFTSSQIIIVGFAGIIFLGTLILMLPLATWDGQGAKFIDALFTATSAVCVTGLVVRDTATYWSYWGQGVILLLIQIGGMGVVTLAVALAMLSGKKISLKQRSTMQEAISAPQVGGIVKFTGFILKMTLFFELLGAILMSPEFCKEFGIAKGIWYSIFHSISAFCNAGFDLFGIKTPYSSLSHYIENPLINFIIMSLIVIGGIGFLTWEDIRTHKWNIKKYRMQSKVIIITTAGLIMIPAIYFFFFEFQEMSFKRRVLSSMFQSITPRTAGFNTTDLTMISESGLLIMMILMIIGGSPGSTAGGMKTTTFAVLISTAISVFRRRETTNFFDRRVEEETIRNASTIMIMYLTLFLVGGMLISSVESLPLLTCLFEAASAIGTVGLTLGITPKLGCVSQIILICLMYLGRVGGLTLIFAAFSINKKAMIKYPKEKMTVG